MLVNPRTPTRAHDFRLPAAALAFLVALATSGDARAEDRDNCLYCHQFPGLSRLDPDAARVRLFFVDPMYVHNSHGPHARLACTDCHERDDVSVVPHKAVTPVDCTRTCHLATPNAPPRRFSHENAARMLEHGAHTRAVLEGLEFTGGPLLNAGQSLCLYCHDEPVFRNPAKVLHAIEDIEGRTFDRCDVCHLTQVPLDTTYYLRHVATRFAPARSTLELAQVCAVCHSDPKVLAAHELPNSVASYVRSFHGKAALLGDESTANCLSCHVAAGDNVHRMLGPENPASAVHVNNVPNGCRTIACHPGADRSIAATAVHLDLPTARGTIDFAVALLFIVLTVISFGPSALIVLLELAHLVVGRQHHGNQHLHALAQQVMAHPDGPRRLQRFAPRARTQHWILTVLFTLLCLTGFPLKFPEQLWSRTLIDAFGGIGVARVVHHWAGIALVVGFLVHLLDILVAVRRRARELHEKGDVPMTYFRAFASLPFFITRQDLRRAGQLIAYLVGLRRDRPTFARFSITEKFEYFGVLWGTSLLGLTGLMLWGEQITSHFLTGRAFNLATIVHTYEAFLAVIHVGILHIYNVVLNPAVFPLSLATLSGHTPLSKLVEENGEFVVQTARELGVSTQESILE